MERKSPIRSGSRNIRTGDSVVVIAGNAKGQSGKVVRCTEDRVVIQGVNMAKKHVKRSQQNPKGGVVEMERPIHISNVAACDPAGQPVKVRAVINGKGQKELVYDKDGEQVTWRSVKRPQKK